MKRFWTAKASPGQRIVISQAMDHREREFAIGPDGEINDRYALEWAIDALIREEDARREARSQSLL